MEVFLEKAFSLANSFTNKRKLISLLIPVKISLRAFPEEKLIQKYKLTEFNLILEAIREGDVMSFERELEKYKINWIRQGIYFLFSELKMSCYRRFVE